MNRNLRPLLVFVMIERFFSSLALWLTQFTTFSLNGGSFFFSFINKVDFFANKDLLCLEDKQNYNGRWFIRNFSSHV